uniref:Uncharacterized protein n=1 Tax=Pithovirus LCPAC001 TaxID=2506585 RepID=A0A481Z3J5_9VIRU|nr:MAG: hypothetical protein LCPAC001_00590 [Pithovirus LCPAC001]
MNIVTEWVSDQDVIPQLIGTSKIKKNNMDRNLTRYVAQIKMCNENYNLIDHVKFVPLILSIILKKNYDYRDIEGLRNTIKHLVESFVFVDVNLVSYQVEKVRKRLVCIYSPTYKGEPIWVSKKDFITINSHIKLEKYYGYKLISSNPLAWYAVSEYQKKYRDIQLEDLFQSKKIMFMKINHTTPFKPKTHTLWEDDEKMNTIRSMILKYEHDGLFVCKYESDIFIKIYIELALLWNGTMINTGTPTIIKTDTYFLEGKAVWYRKSAERILEGTLPEYTLVLKLNKLNMVKTSYKKLSKHNPLLKSYKPKIEIKGDNILVTSIFGSFNDVIIYKQLLNSFIPLKLEIIEPTLPGNFIYICVAAGVYEIFFSIKSEFFIRYSTYDSFLNIPNIKIDPDRTVIPYMIIKTNQKEVKKIITKLNDLWMKKELITIWGEQVFKSVSRIKSISMSRLMLKKI